MGTPMFDVPEENPLEKTLLHKRVFQGLLRGDPSNAQELSIAYGGRSSSNIDERYHIYFSSPYFLLVKLQPIDGNEAPRHEAFGWRKTSEELQRDDLIHDVMETHLSALGDAYHLEVDGHICVMVNLSGVDPSEDYISESQRLSLLAASHVKTALSRLSQVLEIPMAGVISSVCCGCEHIQQLFREVKRLAEYQRVLDCRESVLSYFDVSDRALTKEQKSQLSAYDRKYLMAVASYEYDDAYAYLCEIIDLCIQDRYSAVAAIQFKIMNHVNYALGSQMLDIYVYDNDELGLVSTARKLQQCQSATRSKEYLRTFFTLLETYFERHQLSENAKVMKILQYIQTHFDDPDLSIPAICSCLNISPQHLTRLLKKHTGINTIDTIQLTRIDAAKALLENTDRTVERIAEAVGYTNLWTFFRNFKKLEGITPSNYRALHSNLSR